MPAGSLGTSVGIFSVTAIITLGTLILRRQTEGHELGTLFMEDTGILEKRQALVKRRENLTSALANLKKVANRQDVTEDRLPAPQISQISYKILGNHENQ